MVNRVLCISCRIIEDKMSFYRTAVFGTKGLLEYTRSGYESAAKKFNPEDLNVDLSNQHIMITGANSVNKMN